MVTTRRAASVAGLSTTAALAAAASGASWYYASRLTEAPVDLAIPEPQPHDVVEVVAVGDDRIVLRGAGAARDGCWGVSSLPDDADDGEGGDEPDIPVAAGGLPGYGQAHEVLTIDGEDVTRAFRPLVPGLEAGPARLDGYAWPPDGSLLVPPALETTYASAVGPAPAWYVPGSSDTWVIAVHGRAAWRHEGFRFARTVAARGHPC